MIVTLNQSLFRVWLLVALVFAFLAPPFFAPDETLHAAWAARYFTGMDPTLGQGCSELEKPIHSFPFEKVMREGRGSVSRDFGNYETASVTREDCTKVVQAGSYVASYLYWPSQLIFALNLNWTSTLFLTRVFQISFFAGLLWFLLKKSERASQEQQFLVFSFLAFVSLPLVVQQLFAISTDYQILLACVGMLALSLADTLGSAQILGALFFVLLGALAKPTFLPLILGLGWMAHGLQSPRARRLVIGGLVTIAALVFLRGLYYMLFGLKNNLSTQGFDSAQAQKAFVLAHPIRTVFVILTSGWTKIFQMPGTRLSWLSVKVPDLTVLCVHVPIFAFWLCLYREKFFRFFRFPRVRSKVFFGLLVHVASITGFIFLTGLSLYILATRPEANFVSGLQARYYFPLLTYFLILVYRFLPEKSQLRIPASFSKVLPASLLVAYGALLLKLWQAFPF